MLPVILTASLAFIITLLAIPATIRVAEQKHLYDIPDARKIHKAAIASLGGVGIFMGFILALLLAVPGATFTELKYFIAGATILFFLGMKDDILILSPKKKFLVQLAAAGVLVHLGGVQIDSMHGLLGIEALPQPLSWFLTYSTIIVVMNAFNLIDGVDGLAGSLGLLTMSVFSAYFFYVGLTAYALMATAMAGSLLAFLIFNYNPAKIFMGDSGSLVLGMVNAVMVIKFIQVAGTSADALPVTSSIALGVAILIVPLADTLRVFSIRILKGRSPFSADRNHIHHLLLARGFNHKQVTWTCVGVNMLFILVAYASRNMGSAAVLLFISSLAILLLSILLYGGKPQPAMPFNNKPFLKPAEPGIRVSGTTKVITMPQEMAMSEN